MADAEVGLAELTSYSTGERITEEKRQPQRASERLPSRYGSESTGLALDDTEKKSPDEWKRDDTSSSAPGDDDLAYRFLTFDTALPIPYVANLSDEQRRNLPTPHKNVHIISPQAWSSRRKTPILWLSCFLTMTAAFCAGGYSPGAVQMEAEWGVSHLAFLVGITMFTTGFAVAPMVLAPFSEINGRKPVFIATGLLFVVCQLCCALTPSYGGMLAARFFLGVGGSTFSTMVGGVVSDMYAADERNAAMALFASGGIFGTGLGPLVCGFIAQHLNWRWQFWVQLMFDGVLIFLVVVLLKETRGSVLLSRKATALNKWYVALEEAGCAGVVFEIEGAEKVSAQQPQRIRWKAASDAERVNLLTTIRISTTRPFYMLFTEPILFAFALWAAFSWMILYLTLGAIPLVYGSVYGFDIQTQGLVFIALLVGTLIFLPMALVQEKLAYKHNWFRFRERVNEPEHRLLFPAVQAPILPIGLFLFGWTARESIHPVVSAIGIMFATLGIFSIYLAAFNYLADVYGAYASSALAAQSFCRNLAGGFIPLYTGAMYRRLGTGGASSLLGGLAVMLGLVPWVLLAKGRWIRSRSKFAVSQGQ